MTYTTSRAGELKKETTWTNTEANFGRKQAGELEEIAKPSSMVNANWYEFHFSNF